MPIAVIAALAARRVFTETRPERTRRLDIAGAMAITLALVGLIYGLTRGEQRGFGDPLALASLTFAIALAVRVRRRRAACSRPLGSVSTL